MGGWKCVALLPSNGGSKGGVIEAIRLDLDWWYELRPISRKARSTRRAECKPAVGAG